MKQANFSAIIQTTLIFPIIFCSLFLPGCGEAGEESSELTLGRGADEYYPQIQNLVFFGTREISLEIAPNVSQPSFAWNAIGLKYVVVTIFDAKIDLQAGRIANPKNAVWTWNTGLGRGREGNLSFGDGADVRNGVIQDTVTPLSPGTYYIAAWGYDENYQLTHSSKEYQYIYQPSPR